ncbi:MAG: tetratricopeptide repeat protein [Planctomyces sp.]
MILANCPFRLMLSPCLLCLLSGMAAEAGPAPAVSGAVLLQASGLQESGQQESRPQESRQSVERLFAALVRNPRYGTSFERIVRWHNQQGSLAELQSRLLDYGNSGPTKSGQPQSKTDAVLPIPTGCTPDSALLLAGMIALHRADLGVSITLLDQASAARPADPLSAWYLARASAQQGNTAAAVAAYERALQLRPGRADLLEIFREYATGLARSQQPEQSLAIWQRMESAFPGDRRVAQLVADSLSREGRWSEALPRFQALAESSEDPEQRVQLQLSTVDVLQQLQRDTDALQTLTSLLAEVEPGGWLARDIRRRIESFYLKRRGPEHLVTFYEEWLKQHPEDLFAMERVAASLQLDNRPGEAERWLLKAVELAPSQSSLRDSLIDLQVRTGKLSDAIRQYEILCSGGNGTEDQRRRFGLLQLKRSDIAEEQRQQLALQAWSPLLTLAESDAAAASRAADLLEQAGLPDKALQLAQAAVRLAPADSQYVEQLGDRLLRRQQPEQARDVWLQLTVPPLQNAQNLLLAAGIFRRAGFAADAVLAMRQALQMQAGLMEHLQFADLLREAGGFGENAAPAAPGARPPAPAECLNEALQHLTLALEACDSEEQQDQVLEQRTRLLLLAGRLNEELVDLERETASGTASDRFLNCWRRALGYEASGNLPAAVAAARQATQLQPTSARVLARLAALLEKSGRLSEAAVALEALVQAAPRQASATLQQLARLELRLGRTTQAVTAASRLTETWPDNPATWQFLSEIAFEAGRPAEALQALRNAVRVSPQDTDALQNLAGVLADQFETAEAIELLWQACDAAADQDTRLELVTRMTSLALRSQRFPEFLERLQRQPRNLEEPLSATLELAQALQESGEFRRAREVIESALAADPASELLLRRAVSLAEREKNSEAAARWQLQLVRSLGTLDEIRRLLTLPNADVRQFSPAELLEEIVSRQPRRSLVHEAVRLALSTQHEVVAEQLCRQQVERDPGDWWCRTWQALLARRAGRTEEAREQSLAVLALKYPATAVPLAQNSASGEQPAELSPAELDAWLQPAPEEPGVYGDAVRICLRMLMEDKEAFEPLTSRLLPNEDISIPAAMTGVLLQQVAPSPAMLKLIDEHLIRRNSVAATALRMRLLAAPQLKDVWQEAGSSGQQIRGTLETLGVQLLNGHTDWFASDPWLDGISLPESVQSAWRKELRFVSEQRSASPHALLRLAVVLRDSAACGRLLQALAAEPPPESAAADLDSELLHVVGPLLELPLDADAVRAALQLVISRSRTLKRPLTSSLLTVEVPGLQGFRHRGPVATGTDLLISRLLGRLMELQPGSLRAVWPQLEQSRELSAGEAALLRCEYFRRRNDRRQLLPQMLAVATEWPADAHLRLWVAELLVLLPSPEQAISVAAAVRSEDPQVLIAAQQLILSTAQSAGLTAAAADAARRLGELPLTQQQQATLIPALSRLGLQQEATALETRLGRSAESRTSVLGRQLQQFLATGRTDRAAEAAWELLRISSGGSLFSGFRPNDDRDDGGDRLQAIRALARLNRLQPLIDRHEAMLENSPDSLPLMEVLVEFHEAAEQWSRVQELQDRMAVLSRSVPPGLRRQAAELEKSGQFSAACDLYLQLQKSDATAFYSDLETFYQAFERCQRRREFLVAVLNADRDIQIEHARLLTTAVTAVIDSDGLVPEAEQTLTALLAIPETRRLALAAALSRSGLADQPSVMAAFAAELETLVRTDAASAALTEAATAEILQLCEGKGRSKLLESAIQQLSATSVRSTPGLSVLAFVCMLAGQHERLPALQTRIVTDLEDAVSNDHPRAPAAAAALMVVLERAEPVGTSAAVSDFRRRLLQGLAANEWGITDVQGRAETALLSLYRSSGRNDLARELVLKRVRDLQAEGNSGPDGIRSLLQTSEQIQYSGNPIEAAGLLLRITPFDLERFTRDLGEDKAIAFRSRWNAARRWNLQQMTAQRILEWLEQTSAASTNLLLELSGTTDPGCTELQMLLDLRLQSQLLTAALQCDWTGAEDRERLQRVLQKMAAAADASGPQLIIAAAAAQSAGLSESQQALLQRLVASLPPAATAESAAEDAPQPTIPDSLYRIQQHAVLLLARKAGDNWPAELLRQVLERALPAEDSGLNTLVELAILNDALLLARQLSLPLQAAEIEHRRNQLTDRQLAAAETQSGHDIQAAVEKLLQTTVSEP